jgi:DNA primase
VSEIVFCFDGDRAGRAAAWRALQQVLSEAREGREIRFLFLPEGEDPDSLVGREGSEHFEARLDSALPLSEYLVSQLLEQADVAHADGKAHFIALVRPLIDKIIPGIYRELLLERVALAINLPAARLEQWMRSPETQGKVPAHNERVRPHGAQSAPRLIGRGTLVTQSISLLLHFPAAASAVTDAQRQELERLTQPGVDVLRELLEQQRVSPATTTAQMLERWRERAEYRRFCELAANDPLVPDRAAAGAELTEAVARLLALESRRRLQVLIDKAGAQSLDESEKQELQALTVALPKDS